MLRWLILFYLALTLGVGGLKWALQSHNAHRMAELDEQIQATRKTTYDANSLLVLTHEYTLRGTERPASQWQAAHRALTRSVAQARPVDAGDEDFDELRDTTANLTALFDSLDKDVPGLSLTMAEERRAMLVDQILSETRLVSDLAHRRDGILFARLQQESRDFVQRDGLLNGLWLVSSLFLAWLLLVRVLRPLEQLRAAARAVQAGDLQARCRYEGPDELGQAAASFNAMTDTLAHAKERMTLAIESADMAVWEYDPQAGTLFWDDKMFALYGRPRTGDVEPYVLWSSSLHPQDQAATEQAVQEAIRTGQSLNMQFRIVRPDGEVRHIRADAHVVRDDAGNALRMVGVNTDITEQTITASRLQEQSALLERVSQLASIGGWRLDLTTRSLYWDAQTRRIHGVPEDYVPALETAIDFYAPEHRPVIAQAVQHGIETGEGWDLELRMLTHTGRPIWVRALGGVEYVAGKAAFLVGAFQDITELKQAAQALQAAKAAAESASAAKGAFLANMSHEIRTPLNAVLGVAHLLETSGLNADQLQLLAKAQMAGRSLLDIVNDVLDLTKIEAGEMALDEALFQPAQLLAEAQAVYGAMAQHRNLSLTVQLDPQMPEWLLGDSARLRQLLNNLVGNALKFTEHGSVQVELEVREPGEQRLRLRLSVRDTGIGIAPEVQATLFQPFIQADVSTTRRFGGTGLGLSIVRRLAEMMGGEAGVNSELGQGSEFWVEVPMSVATAQQQRDAISGKLEVVVVQALAADRLELTTTTRALGWRVSLLDSGEELVDAMARRVQQGEPLPDVLIVDGQMTGEDGLQALQSLAERIGPARLPAALLLISDYERTTVATHDHQQLVSQILTKPVGASALFNAVNQSILQRTGNTDKVMQSTELDMNLGQWLPGVQVLVVDDSDINLEVAQRMLQRQGARVQTCSNGRQALQRLREGADDIDVVLMDVQMPDMDGLEATRQVRGTLGLTALPIVALTAGALTEERDRALAAGMNDFLSKPMDPQALLRKIRRLVEQYRARVLPLMPASHPAPRPVAAAAPASAWAPLAGVDMEQAAARLSGDWPLFVSILQRLLGENADLMQAPATEGDAAWRRQLAARLHKLRGSAGMVGAHDLMRRAAMAEEAVLTHAAAAPALQALAGSLQALQAAAAPWLQARAAEAAGNAADDHAQPLSTSELEVLAGLLRGHDLEALTWVGERAAALRATLGADLAARFQSAIEALDFPAAARLLPGP